MSGGLRLRELWIYPVKSMSGVRLDSASVVARGLAGDRRYMVVDGHGRFITQRERAELATVRPELTDRGVVLELPDGRRARAGRDGAARTVTIWGEQVAALDVGDEAAALLKEHLGVEARLVYMPDETRRPADAEDRRPEDVVSFADGFPFLLTTEASLAALNARLGAPVDVRRFRPNLVLGGSEAFVEDDWATLTIGPIGFRSPKPCSRCAIVDVDPDRGARDKRVLGELGRFRRRGRQVNFGLNLVHDGTGELTVGMPVEVGAR